MIAPRPRIGAIVQITDPDSAHFQQICCVIGYDVPAPLIIGERVIDDGTWDLKVRLPLGPRSEPDLSWSMFNLDEVEPYQPAEA